MYRFDLVLCLLTHVFFFRGGSGSLDVLTVEGTLKRLFSLRQRRAMGGYSGSSICFASSSRVAAWSGYWVGSHLVVVPSVEFIEGCIVIVSKLLKLVPHVYNHVPRLVNLSSSHYGMFTNGH